MYVNVSIIHAIKNSCGDRNLAVVAPSRLFKEINNFDLCSSVLLSFCLHASAAAAVAACVGNRVGGLAGSMPAGTPTHLVQVVQAVVHLLPQKFRTVALACEAFATTLLLTALRPQNSRTSSSRNRSSNSSSSDSSSSNSSSSTRGQGERGAEAIRNKQEDKKKEKKNEKKTRIC